MTRTQITELRALFDEMEAKHGRDIAFESVLDCMRFMRDTNSPRRAGSVKAAKALVYRVADAHGLTGEQIFSDSRVPAIAWARFEAWARIKAMGFGPKAIGRMFTRDHATVIHGLRRFAEAQPELARDIADGARVVKATESRAA